MREIKFRAWDKEFAEMNRVTSINFIDEFNKNKGYEGVVYLEGYIDAIPLSEIELMQYTGLKDKNGKEIFEGDILLYLRKSKRIVSYKNGAFIRYYENYNEYLLYDSFIEDGYLTDYEVIGNIYENPELLEGNQYESITDNK